VFFLAVCLYAVTFALPNQNTPNGYYNIERMVKAVLLKKGKVKLCGSCAEARGLKELKLVDGAELSKMKELIQLTMECDKMVTFLTLNPLQNVCK
jgi:uncharacterized protein involved in oxidation of intracellular sulfur